MEEKNYLSIAIEIKDWIEKSPEQVLPSKKSKDEEEKRLAKELIFIRKKLIKPYQKLKKDKDIKKFEEKHPNIYEIVKTIQKIDEKSIIKNINESENELIEENKKIDLEIEVTEDEQTLEFEYDKENEKQSDLVGLIVKDIKLKKTIEEANKLKEKYKK